MYLENMNDDDLLALCGGSTKMQGGEKVAWFGMNPSDPKTTEKIGSPFNPNDPTPQLQGNRIILSQFAKLINGGVYPAYSWQLTGSCVNSGAQNTIITLEGVTRALTADRGVFKRPFTLAAYGLSRKQAFNDDTPGEGSTGDAMANALLTLGACEFDFPELPVATEGGHTGSPPIAFHYTKEQELFFSAAHNASKTILAQCKAHPLKFTVITTPDQAEIEIRRGRAFTIAGNWGGRMQMAYKGSGTNRVLFSAYESNWEHQMSVHGFWHHPEFGRLWLVMQNWYMVDSGGNTVPVHGQPANDEPPGSFWVDDSMIQHQLAYKYGELRAYYNYTGLTNGDLNLIAV